MVTRIAPIHALAHSVAPINDALGPDWPQARRMSLLGDSLASDPFAACSGLPALTAVDSAVRRMRQRLEA